MPFFDPDTNMLFLAGKVSVNFSLWAHMYINLIITSEIHIINIIIVKCTLNFDVCQNYYGSCLRIDHFVTLTLELLFKNLSLDCFLV